MGVGYQGCRHLGVTKTSALLATYEGWGCEDATVGYLMLRAGKLLGESMIISSVEEIGLSSTVYEGGRPPGRE